MSTFINDLRREDSFAGAVQVAGLHELFADGILERNRGHAMSRKGWTVAAGIAILHSLGCNRQDADALSNIGQMLAQRARSLPIITPQTKPIATQPVENRADQNQVNQ